MTCRNDLLHHERKLVISAERAATAASIPEVLRRWRWSFSRLASKGETVAQPFEELKANLLALHGQERYEEALLLLQESVASRPEHRSRIEFWAACLECRLERPSAAMRRLQALTEGGGWVSPLRLTTERSSGVLVAC